LPVLDFYRGVAGTASDDVVAVGAHTLLHFDGVRWAPIRARTLGLNDGFRRAAVWPHAVAIIGLVNNAVSGVADVLVRHGRWACRATETSCDDGVDDDCDGLIDHEDPDCP